MAMRVHISDASCLVELVHDLLRGDCLPLAVNAETLEIVHLDAHTADEARTELTFFLRAWQSRHPGVEVRLA